MIKPWRVLRFNQPKFAKATAALMRYAAPDPTRANTVAEIIAAVRHEGDAALVRLAKKYDKIELTASTLLVPPRKFSPPEDVVEALDYALRNIREFSKLRKPRNWSRTNREGATVGEKFDPLERVGIYVPGGTAPLVSTALMTVALAKEAHVREIVVTTPGPVDATLRYALIAAGATEIYQVGGAQAIAALAYGTDSIARVQKISDPAMPGSSRLNGRWSARWPSTSFPARARSRSSPTRRPRPRSSRPTCWHRPNMAPAARCFF